MTFSGNFMPPRFGADAPPKPKPVQNYPKITSANPKATWTESRPASQDGDPED